ncbi:hypothetical protein [Streptomyces sp. NPDC003688]
MTNDELLADLKQFITATVSQATADLATKQDLENVENGIRTKMKDGFKAVDAKFDEVLNAVGAELEEHESALTRLKRIAGQN